MNPIKSGSKKQFWNGLSQANFGFDWILVVVVAGLTTIGLTMLASGLSINTENFFYAEYTKQIASVFLGVILAFYLAREDYQKFLNRSNTLLQITFGMLIFLAFFGLYAIVFDTPINEVTQSFASFPIRPFSANNSVRWISLPQLPNFQPIELAKISLLLYFAKVLQKPAENGYTWPQLKMPFYTFLAVGVLSLIQPDLGSVVLIFLILLSSMISVKVPLKIIFSMLVVISLSVTFFVYTASYRMDRFGAVGIDCTLNPSDEGYQICQVRKAIRAGGITGQGYTFGSLKQSGNIPEATTDAIITVFAEELGFILTVCFLFLYLILISRGLEVANRCPDPGGKALATGISSWIGLQAFLNILGITGMIPLTGIPLPFVSAGGSAMVVNFVAFGILISVDRTSKATMNFKNKKFFN